MFGNLVWMHSFIFQADHFFPCLQQSQNVIGSQEQCGAQVRSLLLRGLWRRQNAEHRLVSTERWGRLEAACFEVYPPSSNRSQSELGVLSTSPQLLRKQRTTCSPHTYTTEQLWSKHSIYLTRHGKHTPSSWDQWQLPICRHVQTRELSTHLVQSPTRRELRGVSFERRASSMRLLPSTMLWLRVHACSRLGRRPSVFEGSKLALEAVQPKPLPALLSLSATIKPPFHISRLSTRHEQFTTRQRHGHPTCITICHMVVVHWYHLKPYCLLNQIKKAGASMNSEWH